ncbi:MAG: hypothetical protein Q9P14_09700, partial [candidate division KSB1 bacterium]|nr:hypothetical protein [candidate division KSB1 bacterium]
LHWWTENQSAYINLYYIETQDKIWLSYYVWENGSYFYRGHGYIPSNNVSGNDKVGFLHLDIDLAQLTDFNFVNGGPVKIAAHIQKTGYWSRIFGNYDLFHDKLTGSSWAFLGYRNIDSADGWMQMENLRFEGSYWGGLGSLKNFNAWFTMPD